MQCVPAIPDGVLVATGLHRFFHAGDEEVQALRDVSLAVERGQVVAVTGPSGSGKSTLLAVLAGLDEPDGGCVWLRGERLSRRTEAVRARLRAEHVGILYQTDNLVNHLSVHQNVVAAQLVAGHRAPSRAGALIEEVGLGGKEKAWPSELSGGEASRAGLAVALANDPVVLLADEPTGNVDHLTERRVMDVLATRAEGGAAVVVMTHSAALAQRAGSRIRLQDGVVVDRR